MLERVLVLSINNVLDLHVSVSRFVDETLPKTFGGIDSGSDTNSYSIGTAFFPLVSTSVLPDEILSRSTWSGYIDNRAIRMLGMSKDFALTIEDMKRQFEATIEQSNMFGLQKLMTPEKQRETATQYMQQYIDFVNRDFFGTNVPNYLHALVDVRMAVGVLRSKGIIAWKWKYSPAFKYFKDRTSYKKYADEIQTHVDADLSPGVEREYEQLVEKYLQRKLSTEQV